MNIERNGWWQGFLAGRLFSLSWRFCLVGVGGTDLIVMRLWPRYLLTLMMFLVDVLKWLILSLTVG